MKANELRLNNIILYKGEAYKISGNYILFKTCVNIERKDKDYEPIPLTEEWLLKFGFIWHGDIKILKGYLNNYVDGNGETHLKYVHQLQNLYFALTNEELKIEL
jgi:hypothetical protein